MRDIRDENREDWGWVTDSMIDSEASNEKISWEIALLTKNLILRRKRLRDRTLELFPAIIDQSPNWRDELTLTIAPFNENELQNMLRNTASVRKLVYTTFKWLKDVTPLLKRDFDTIFHDKNIYVSDKNISRVERIHREYYRLNTIPDTGDINFILSNYRGAPNTRKKEILSALAVTFTLQSAVQLWLIDNDFLKIFAKGEFAGAYDRLNEDQKESFIRGLEVNTTYAISPADMDEAALGWVFSDEQKRKILAHEAFRSIALDMPEKENWLGNSMLSRIKDRKTKEAEARGIEEFNYDIYDEFVEDLKYLTKWEKGIPYHIENREILKEKDAVLQFQHKNGSTQFIRITQVRGQNGNPIETSDGMEYGIEFETLNVTDGKLWSPSRARVSYDQFEKFLSEHDNLKGLSAQDFENLLTKDISESGEWKDKIYDARTIDTEPTTAANIASKLDMLDFGGAQYGFEAWTAFVAPIQDEKSGRNNTEGGIWTVKKIHGNMVDLVDPWGNISERNLPLDQVYQVLQQNPSLFKRIAKIKDDTQMLDLLKWFGVDALKEGNMYIRQKDDHGHLKDKQITTFQTEKWGHIRMEYLKDGIVRFWEYDADAELSKVKEYAKKNGLDKKVKWLYTWRSMSYPAFLKYLEKDKYTASAKDNIIVDHAAHDLHGDGHGHHPHVHGSIMSRIFQMQNLGSIWKGFEMVFHGIEHTLEKWAKLDAAKFALKTAKFLHLSDTVAAQIYSDVVDGSKEILEKYEKKISGLPGPFGREKCLHIVENQDSRPEEVASAMNFMLKNYGHLYAEDLKHKQSIVQSQNQWITASNGTFLFFDAFVATAKLGDLQFWRKAAYKKAIAEMGSEDNHDGEPTEEQLIHALFKEIDGAWDKFPYAASVVKAMGGAGGYERTYKLEGYPNAKKKWSEQTQMVSPQGRLNKAIGYLGSHEIYKWIGSMEAVVAKVKEPKFQAFPFVWAVGWFSRYASQAALNDIKWYAEKWYSFHAYAFMKTPAENVIYKKVVRLALENKWGTELLNKFDALSKRLEYDPDNYEHTSKAALGIMKLWQDHCDGEDGLHSMLQWHNGWLIKKARDGDPEIKEYLRVLTGKHSMQLNGTAISGNEIQEQYNEWGLRHNRIMSYNKESGLLSLERTLKKIPLGARGGSKIGDRKMVEDDYDKLWGAVGEQMKTIRDPKFFDNDEVLRKEQFITYRKEIIDFFVRELNARTPPKQTPDNIEQLLALPHYYWRDIEKMWIDPHSIFDKTLEDSTLEDDYSRWVKGMAYSSWMRRSGNTLDLTSLVQGKAANATVRSMVSRTPPLRSDEPIETPYSPDYDLSNPGGAADPGYDGD